MPRRSTLIRLLLCSSCSTAAAFGLLDYPRARRARQSDHHASSCRRTKCSCEGLRITQGSNYVHKSVCRPATMHNVAQNELTPTDADPDRVRRRKLLLAMLAAAGFSNAEPTSAQSATPAVVDPIRVIKPPLDEREYLALTLENGLRVLLCSDASSNEAAVAMDVHVGACSDPDDVAGLAHFNEHMLFLGTKRYPKEDSFESFLASNSGVSNAYTDSENTVYYFEMTAEADARIAEGLDRFGAFFTEPLFSPGATGRELNAIESENAKNLQSDVFRSFQMTKSRANQNHPFSKFFTGNKKTLLDDTVAKGIDLREQLVSFYNAYYSANQMTLAVVAPQPLEKLKNMVTNSFSSVPNKKVGKPEEAWAGQLPFVEDGAIVPSFRHKVEVVPVSDLRQVTIAWPVVYQSEKDRLNSRLAKPTTYVAHLLGHEGPNSLLSYLKRKGWANSLASASAEELSDFEMFELVIGLTTKGLSAINSVVEAIFSEIKMLRDRKLPDYIFQEVLQLEELQWRFTTKGRASNYATSLATAMQIYPTEFYIAGPRRLGLETPDVVSDAPRSSFASRQQLDETRDIVEDYVKQLTVDTALVAVLSKAFENETNQKEKWYGTDYRANRIPDATLDQWRNAVPAKKLKIDVPKPNPFIPTEKGLEVKIPAPRNGNGKKSFEARMKPLSPPVLIRDDGDNGRWTVYFKQDDRFGLPKAFVIFQVLTNEVFASARKAALANFFEIAVSDKLGEYAYDASLAGLTYDVKVLPRGVRLTFGGYNDKLQDFAAYVSKKLSKDIRDLLPKNDNAFDRYKDQIMRALSAFDVKQPYAHAAYYGQLCLQPRHFQYSNQDLRDETRKITLPDLVQYVNSLWSSGKGEALIQGNVDEAEALELVKAIGDALPFRPASPENIPPRLQALPLPPSRASTVPPRLLIPEPNAFEANAVSYVILQNLRPSEKDHVLIELLGAIVDEPFFADLRTKQQLGYVVSSGVRAVAETRTLGFLVQSSIARADSLTVQILKFLESVEEKLLQPLSKASFAIYIKSLIDRKTETDKDLSVEVTRNWSEIAAGRFQFDRIQAEAAALLELEKEDLLEFWRRLYIADGRRILITEIVPRQGAAASEMPPASTEYEADDLLDASNMLLGIDDIAQFRFDREKWITQRPQAA